MRAVLRTFALGCLLFAGLRCEPTPPPSKPNTKSVTPSPPTRSAALPPAPRFTSRERGQSPDAPPVPPSRATVNNLIVEAPPTAALTAGESPISLTASDGTGLRLAKMAARVVVQGPLAFTELQLHFENREARRLEGRFSITLPSGAAISRFAMHLPQGWQEAEVVERQAARRAYEDFLHRRQDPALLEHEAGNQFSARVFPIEANGVKELRISYSQELPSTSEPYRLPLVGLPEMAEFDVTAIAGDQVTALSRRAYRPTSDLVIRPPDNAAGRAAGLIADELVVVRTHLADAPQAGPSPPLRSLLVLFDTSASRAAGFATQLRELGAFLQQLPDATLLTIACFDQAVETIYEGPRAGLSDAVYTRITQRGPLGASNLQAALTFAAERRPSERILLFTDGVVTAGASDKELTTPFTKLREAGTQRLDVALFGGIRDAAAMTALTRGHLPQDGMVISGDKGASELLRRFSSPTLSGVQVAVTGASWVWPQQLSGVQPGDDVIIYAELAANSQAPAAVVKLSGGGLQQESSLPLVTVKRPLVERAIVRAYLERLDQSIAALDAKQSARALKELHHEAVTLSTRFRVLGNDTALLVLESAADYQRFSIDQKALADILIVGDHGIELIHRTDPVLARKDDPDPRHASSREGKMGKRSVGEEQEKAQVVDPRTANDANVFSAPPGNMASIFGRDTALGIDGSGSLGGLVEADAAPGGFGFVGSGRGGGGTGEGTIGLGNLGTVGRGAGAPPVSRSRRAAIPSVIVEPVQVRGGLPPEIIRRVVRVHMNEVRFCYESELLRNPSLQGRIMMQFVIAPSGDVVQSSVQSSTINNPRVEHCIAAAIRRWPFPRPNAGIVIVNYPLKLEPSGGVILPNSTSPPIDVQRAATREVRDPSQVSTPAYSGKLAQVMALLNKGQYAQALPIVEKWRTEDAGDILAIVALGEVLEARGDVAAALRAYGSIIDLFPSRADLRRFAGERLERLSGAAALALAIDTYEKAVAQRPDHPAGHRLHAYALLKQGQFGEAFTAIEKGANLQYPDGRFRRAVDVLREDAELIGAAWAHKDPSRRTDIETRLGKLHATLPTTPSTRFVLNWETDANDVDFHIRDGRGGHAFYSNPTLPSGGELYADVTTGYGPECFNISGTPRAFPYKLEAHYYSRGPMGYGMGKLQIIAHDGAGTLKFVERPFVVMNDHAYVDLGILKAPL